MTKQYDIFISYRTTNRTWVEILALNLTAQGYTVFLDAWGLIGGQNIDPAIDVALNKSRFGLLIATPDITESGWVQDEYAKMRQLERDQPDFCLIPIIFQGQIPDMPFLKNRLAIDFANSAQDTYRSAFKKLVCALERQASGANPIFAGDLQFPPIEPLTRPLVDSERDFVSTVYNILEQGNPLMILAQAGTCTQHYSHAIYQRATQRYGSDHVMWIVPPVSTEADSAAYFSCLAEQCGLAGDITTSWDWSIAMKNNLKKHNTLLLFITGFENGSDKARQELAGEMRGLLEKHASQFKLIIMGGFRLNALGYEVGPHSLLNMLTERRLPPLNLIDFKSIYLHRYPGLNLSDAVLQEMLEFTGQHPRLLEACLQAVQQDKADWRNHISQSIIPSQLYASFRNKDDHDALCHLLQKEQLGRFTDWLENELLRRLYWQNLLTDRNGQLVWRCDLIRNAGKELLGC